MKSKRIDERRNEKTMNRHLVHTPEGVRDIYGAEYARKLQVENALHEPLRLYGYEDIQTPTFEFFDVFSREIGTTPSKELYKFFDKEGNTLVLRPDFTPSIARCSAKYFLEQQESCRLCYLGNTFTNTSDLQGKLKEVTQMGAELIGESGVEADAEMISLVVESLKSAGLEEFQVSVGQVEYFKGICEAAGIDADTEQELRELISNKNYFGAQALLSEKQVPDEYANVLLKITDLFGSVELLQEAKTLAANEHSYRAAERLEKLYEVLKLYGVEEYVSFDLGMLSKYHYYTGVLFKAYTYGAGDAIVKGGRYDTLLEHFGKPAPAIGFAIVVDDLLWALSRQNIPIALPEDKVVLSCEADNLTEMLAKARRLRAEGRVVEVKRKKEPEKDE